MNAAPLRADTALRLERYLGMSADFWLALQKDYDLQTVRQAAGQQIKRDINLARARRETGILADKRKAEGTTPSAFRFYFSY